MQIANRKNLKSWIGGRSEVIHAILNLSDKDFHEGYYKRLQKYYNIDKEVYIIEKLNAISDLIGGFGTESIEIREGDFLYYVNMGESYTWTVIYYKGKFRLNNWGSIAERYT